MTIRLVVTVDDEAEARESRDERLPEFLAAVDLVVLSDAVLVGVFGGRGGTTAFAVLAERLDSGSMNS